MRLINPLLFSLILIKCAFCQDVSLPISANAAIDTIISHQKRLKQLRASYVHKRSINTSKTEYQGLIDYKAPEHIMMHFMYPADEFVLVNDSTVLIYGVKNNYGIKYNRKCLKDSEKQIAEQIGQIKMNILQSMRASYTFSYLDTNNIESVMISATPNSGWKSLSKILIAIDLKKYTLKSVEIFGKNKSRISSTVYADFQFIKTDSLWFPRSIAVDLLLGNVTQKDTISYSRLDYTVKYSSNHFKLPVAKNATIVDNNNDCK